MDYTGEKIPKALRDLLDSAVLKQRSSQLSLKESAEILTTVLNIANNAEDKVHVYELKHGHVPY